MPDIHRKGVFLLHFYKFQFCWVRAACVIVLLAIHLSKLPQLYSMEVIEHIFKVNEMHTMGSYSCWLFVYGFPVCKPNL